MEQTQDDILDAAVERFSYYGVSKTTLSDIASDVDMSTANLYRYFKNKEDILVACCRRCLNDRINCLEQVVADTTLKADEKLGVFFHEILKYTYDQFETNSGINELVNIIAEKHKQVVHDKNKAEQALIKRILEQGITEHLFNIADLEKSTIAVHTSLHLFQLPLSMSIHDLETLKNMANMTTDLLLNGLYTKNSS